MDLEIAFLRAAFRREGEDRNATQSGGKIYFVSSGGPSKTGFYVNDLYPPIDMLQF